MGFEAGFADAVPEFPPGIHIEGVTWTEDGWREALAGAHIGLAPLPDDAWTRGKCGLKVLQAMSVGRPVVASAVGVQREQVVDGVTGYLAETRERDRRFDRRVVQDPGNRPGVDRA